MAAVQFCGTASVVQAFKLAKGVTCWAIFQGKELITSGTSEEELTHFLGLLAPGGSAATYALRLYKEEIDGDDIERDTPYGSSFNFKLTDGLYNGQAMGRAAPADPILAGIQDHLYKKVAAAVQAELNGDNEDEEEETLGDLLKGLLKEPEKLAGLINSVKGFFGRGMGMPVALAGTMPQRAGSATQGQQPPTAEELVRLQNALDILGKCDPQIIPHLEKLAVLARDKPSIYKMAIAQLNEF